MSLLKYKCNIYFLKEQLEDDEFGIAISARTYKTFLAKIRERKDWKNWKYEINKDRIIDAIRKYSDRYLNVTDDPIEEINSYFRIKVGWTLGGLPTNFDRLYYSISKLLPPTSLIGAISEGISGIFLEEYLSMTFIGRPVGIESGCDGILQNKNKKIGLLEVKGTTRGGKEARKNAIDASYKLLRELNVAYICDHDIFFAFSIGVSLIEPFEVYCIEYILE